MCEYCDSRGWGNKPIEKANNFNYFQIIGNESYCCVRGTNESIKINNCPMCGKKLEYNND